MTDTTADILRKARDHIAQPGMWCQGRFFDAHLLSTNRTPTHGPCCARGALIWATGTPDNETGLSYLAMAVPQSIPGVTAFNDAPGRTQSEVVALFDRAIELAEKEATP